MIAIQSMTDVITFIDLIDDLISILLRGCSKNGEFIIL